MMRRVATTIAVAAAALAACSDEGPGPQSAYRLTIAAGDSQADTVGKTLPVSYAVLVKDTSGTPLSGIALAWSVTGGGGAITPTSSTDGAGLATATRTLGTAAGTATAKATVDGVSVTFTATARAGAPVQASKSAGDQQSGAPGAPLPVPFAVLVQDQYGNPVESVTVNWAVTAGGGSLSASASKTDGSGVARTTLTLGAIATADTVTATVPAITGTLRFSATATIQPVLVRSLPMPQAYGIHDMYVRDGLAFVCVWDSGVIIFDVGNGLQGGSPSNPLRVSKLVTSGGEVHNAWWFHNPSTNQQKYLFIGQEGPGIIGDSSSGDIHVVDVSNLASPVEVGAFHLDGAGTHNFWVDETAQILYAAYYNGGVVAIDVSGTTLPSDLSTRAIDTIAPGGAANTFVWGVQLYNGSLYATDMLSGLWQLGDASGHLSVAAGGNNVTERYSSDLWVANGYAYTGTWYLRGTTAGNALKIWQLGAGGAPILRDSIITAGIFTVSDVEVSASGNLLMFSAEGGPNAGFHFYSLANPAQPTFLGKYLVGSGVHTATFATINGRKYAFGAKDPSGAALIILDVTSLDP